MPEPKQNLALDKDIRAHLKLSKSLLDREASRQTPGNKGAPAPQDRENILRLKNQGWTVQEIADAMNMSRGEVELTLEIATRS